MFRLFKYRPTSSLLEFTIPNLRLCTNERIRRCNFSFKEAEAIRLKDLGLDPMKKASLPLEKE
jgi:hypothetical protein